MARGEGRDVERPRPGESIEERLDRIARSAFRARFHLRPQEVVYARSRGREAIMQHAHDFIAQRLAPAAPRNDGKQTPMGGHPVFRGQHATGTCCRGCLAKHHGYSRGRELTPEEQDDVVEVIMCWIDRELRHAPTDAPAPPRSETTPTGKSDKSGSSTIPLF